MGSKEDLQASDRPQDGFTYVQHRNWFNRDEKIKINLGDFVDLSIPVSKVDWTNSRHFASLDTEITGSEESHSFFVNQKLSTNHEDIKKRQTLIQRLMNEDNLLTSIKNVQEEIITFNNIDNGYMHFKQKVDSWNKIIESLENLEDKEGFQLSTQLYSAKSSFENWKKKKEDVFALGKYFGDADILESLAQMNGIITEYNDKISYNGQDSGNVFIDSIEKRRSITDTILLTSEILKEMQEQNALHKISKEIALISNGWEAYSNEAKKLWDFKSRDKYRKYFQEQRESLLQLEKMTTLTLKEFIYKRRLPKIIAEDTFEEIQQFITVAETYKTYKEQGLPVIMPEIVPIEERVLELEKVYNLPLLAQKEFNLNLVDPISFRTYGEKPVTVLSGPNTGGKTTLGKLLLQIQFIAQAGLPIIGKKAVVSPVDYLAHIEITEENAEFGDGQYGKNLGSSNPIIMKATPYSFLYLDEFGTGSDTDEIARISKQVYGHFVPNGIRTVHSTHHKEMAKESADDKIPGTIAWGIKNDKHSNPIYNPVEGIVGDSNGPKIAADKGFKEENFERRSKELMLSHSKFYESNNN